MAQSSSGPVKKGLMVFPGRTIVLPLRYYGNIGYYAAMAACGRAVICADALFDKRAKAVHRCDIADTHGPVSLTVPIAKPHGIARARWSDVRLSDHGAWWHVHRVTLESAYGRTPFFEYYIDRFLPYLTPGVMELCPTIADLDLAIDSIIREILLIDTEVSLCGGEVAAEEPECVENADMPAYYQVRAHRQGFIPGLSVLDLIFNLGPEAPLYLRGLTDRLAHKHTACEVAHNHDV